MSSLQLLEIAMQSQKTEHATLSNLRRSQSSTDPLDSHDTLLIADVASIVSGCTTSCLLLVVFGASDGSILIFETLFNANFLVFQHISPDRK